MRAHIDGVGVLRLLPLEGAALPVVCNFVSGIGSIYHHGRLLLIRRCIDPLFACYYFVHTQRADTAAAANADYFIRYDC